MNIDVDVLIHVSNGTGGVTSVVAGIFLHQVRDDDGIGRHLSPRVRWRLLYGFPVVDPRNLGHGSTAGLALDLSRFTFSEVLEFWLDREEWRG